MERAEAANLLSQLHRDAALIAERFALRYLDIKAEHPRVKARYGACYSDGLIKIRLNHARTGQPLRYSSLIDTLCHELAHLKHFNHGPEFKTFYLQLLGWARRQGIYRPRTCRGDEPQRHASGRRARQRLPERNGVLVFPDGSPTAQTARQLPWERGPAAAPGASALVPMPTRPSAGSTAGDPPPPDAPPTTRRQGGAALGDARQLTLF